MSQSPELVAPFGSKEAILGTNPLAVGVPVNSVDGIPWVVDMATSAMALFQAVQSKNLAPGIALNSEDGTDITDGSQLANALTGGGKAALLPWGGHKGAALGLIVEILAGRALHENVSRVSSSLSCWLAWDAAYALFFFLFGREGREGK